MGVLGRIQAVGQLEVTRTLDLGDFDEAFRGAVFEVWVTPTRAHLEDFAELTKYISSVGQAKGKLTEEEKADTLETWQSRLVEWYAKTWRNISHDEARQIHDALPEVAWDWLLRRSSETIGQYRREKLGNSNGG